MTIKIFENYIKLSSFIAEEIREQLDRKPGSLLCIAAGNTSLGLFEELVRMNKNGEIDFSKAHFVAMDEWLNMNLSTEGSCSSFLYENFFRHVNVPHQHIRYVDGRAKDIGLECLEIKQLIDNFGGIDYLVLGSGMNGHLALNEPGVDFASTVHQTGLDAVTQQVGQKYFQSKADLVGGVTIGIREISGAKRTVLAVNSAHKSEILKKIVESPVTNAIPATIVKQLDNSVIACDLEAASLLEDSLVRSSLAE